jgi:hypothetical protein
MQNQLITTMEEKLYRWAAADINNLNGTRQNQPPTKEQFVQHFTGRLQTTKLLIKDLSKIIVPLATVAFLGYQGDYGHILTTIAKVVLFCVIGIGVGAFFVLYALSSPHGIDICSQIMVDIGARLPQPRG